ncbi:DUF2279 domain-containing protein [Algibacter lectus]|uniref:DUF2279 domain-containing protein n=1 Tax=Algibacter lectus TaxID=221126 RepID=UPI0026E99A2B|nr:DUF2279 domain-containing protein [Algibacter lectus]MDO7135684.1 DUF2279 domain-containing protein [Algibacter lectus]
MAFKVKYALFLLLVSSVAFSQKEFNSFFIPSDSLNTSRRNVVVYSEAALASITLIGLNQLWYADYERSKFHTLNDNDEWLQMDKFGHAFSAYQMGKHGAQLLNWSGISGKGQILYGATLGFGFLTAVEMLDGYSDEWGFSWGDILANASGTSLYIGQELLWKEQRIALKYSFHQTKYAKQNPDKLGNGLLEEVLKDYNGQTYWLSANMHAFFKDSKIPKWLNLAVGYGGEGMLAGVSSNVNDLLINDLRYRQVFLSLDLDLEHIKTNSAFLKTVFSVFNMIKLPFPTLEFGKKGCVFHLLYI